MSLSFYRSQCIDTFPQQQQQQQLQVVQEEVAEDVESVADEEHLEQMADQNDLQEDAYDEADDEEVSEESSYEEEDDLDDEEVSDDKDVGGQEDEDSVLEVIDLSDEEEPAEANPDEFVFSSSPSSSSSSSSQGEDGGMPPPGAVVSGNVATERNENEGGDVGNAGDSPGRWHYGELHADSNVEHLYADIVDIEQVAAGQEHEQEELAVASTSPDDIQVPTTSSSTHRTEGGEGLAASEAHGDGEAESSEVEDLSVQQAEETGDVVAARDLSVAGGEQWPDSVASSSSGERAAAVAVAAAAAVPVHGCDSSDR